MLRKAIALLGCVAVLASGSSAIADVFNMDPNLTSLEFVTVGNVGNSADSTGYGAVDYEYNIGKYEVTNAQYAEFLNAVATVGDAHGLYKSDMGGGWMDIGGISRTGSGAAAEPWVYSPRTGRGNRPVNYVSFWDASRFANWLHNGRSAGQQDLTTTEDGAYLLNGVTNPPGDSITRKPGARAWVPTEDEWYKAAYYKGGGTDAGYWDYATQSDTPPTPEVPPGTDLVNGSANHWNAVPLSSYTTDVGAYSAMPSVSAYGTFDQNGNLHEWVDGFIHFLPQGQLYRVGRGGGPSGTAGNLEATARNFGLPTYDHNSRGFRVASEIPEPATLSLLTLGGLAIMRRKRRR